MADSWCLPCTLPAIRHTGRRTGSALPQQPRRTLSHNPSPSLRCPEVRDACHAPLGARPTVQHMLSDDSLCSSIQIPQIFATISTYVPANRKSNHHLTCIGADCRRPRHLASSAAVIFNPMLGRRYLSPPANKQRQLFAACCYAISFFRSACMTILAVLVRNWPDERTLTAQANSTHATGLTRARFRESSSKTICFFPNRPGSCKLNIQAIFLWASIAISAFPFP
jgi:hypothetical protein